MEPVSDESIQAAQDAIIHSGDRIIKDNINTFKQNIAATLEYELVMMKREKRDGDDFGAEYHKFMASIYQSVLDRV